MTCVTRSLKVAVSNPCDSCLSRAPYTLRAYTDTHMCTADGRTRGRMHSYVCPRTRALAVMHFVDTNTYTHSHSPTPTRAQTGGFSSVGVFSPCGTPGCDQAAPSPLTFFTTSRPEGPSFPCCCWAPNSGCLSPGTGNYAFTYVCG